MDKNQLIPLFAMAGLLYLTTLVKSNIVSKKDKILQVRSKLNAANDRKLPLQLLYKSNQMKEDLDIIMTDNTNTTIQIPRICITGGPCAGKTTGLNCLATKLRERGYTVYLVPEAATCIFMGGGMLDIGDLSDDEKILFQINLLRQQIAFENTFHTLAVMQAQKGKKCVLLCDRGLMDGKAYVDLPQWKTMLARYNLDEVEIRDKRYDLVVHLVTAADGTNYYSQLNNAARHETQEQALEMDRKTQAAWLGHPNLVKIDNHSINSFDEKMDWLQMEVSKTLGFPFQTQYKQLKVYLLRDSKDEIINPYCVSAVVSKIQHVFLKTDDKNKFLKLCVINQDKQQVFMLKEKHFKKMENGKIQKAQLTKNISRREYQKYYEEAKDPVRTEINKTRISFSYEGQSMIVDRYNNLQPQLSFLKVKNPYASVKFPPFLNVIKEISPSQVPKMKDRYISDSLKILLFNEDKKDIQFRKGSLDQQIGQQLKEQKSDDSEKTCE